MKACNRSAVRVSAWCLWALVAACFATVAQAQSEAPAGAAAATTQPAAAMAPTGRPTKSLTAEELPDPQSFKAGYKPGDDGKAIVVEWARPVKENSQVQYVLEMARTPEDLALDNPELRKEKVREKIILPMLPDKGDKYQTEIVPAGPQFFPLPEFDIVPAIKAALDEKVLTPQEAAKAMKIKAFIDRQEGNTVSAAEPAAATAPASMTATTSSQPASAAKPEELSDEDGQWYGKVRTYLENRAKLRDFATPQKNWITPDQMNRALAALSSEFRDEKTPQAKDEITWLGYLMGYLKKKEDDQTKEKERAINGSTWYFRLAAARDGQRTYVSGGGQPIVLSAHGQVSIFMIGKLNNLVFSLIFCGIVFAFIQIAKRRPNLFIRKIAGLEAMDEAIGRSTEMNKPVFFVHGLGDMSDVATISSVNILGRVATKTAEYDSRVKVMNIDPIVTAVSQEVVQQSYRQAGRPDAFNPDDVTYVASDQFSYVAAVSGRMVREQPGAIFLLGSFMAESLLLAETGASTGAIQVAGTDQFTQLPFFITTCDYTLIGEELYAASAYLSREPRLLGSLRGQDVGKAFLMITIILCCIALTVGLATGHHMDWLREIFKAMD